MATAGARKPAVVLVVLLLALLGLAEGGAADPRSEPPPPPAPEGATLRVGLTQEIDSMNPFLGFSLASTDIFRAIYPTLTTYNPKDFAPEPELADHWQVAPDKLTWTFHIRPGVRWSDGAAVTARDAAYTYNRMMTDPSASTANGNFVQNFDAVRAPDEQTLVITTKTPQATMLAIDAPIVPEHVWSKIGDVTNYPNDRMPIVGSGPFVVTDYEPEQKVILRANKDYWRGPPRIDELRFVSFKNTDAEVQALRKGEIDVAQKLTPTQFAAVEHAPNIRPVKGQGRRFYELLLNPGATNSNNEPIGTGHPALKDVRVRRAIERAIDRRKLVDRVLNGYGQVGSGYIPPLFDKYHWQQPRPNSFDPAAANRELDRAGYRRGPDGIRRTPQGRPLNFSFVLHGDEAKDSRVGEFIKQWLANIGIGVTLESVSDNQVNDRTTSGNYDMIISGYSANPDPDQVLRLQTCAARPSPDGGGQPDSFLCDRRYDELYQRQRAEFDPAARQRIVKEAQQRYARQDAGLILFYDNQLEAYRSDRFQGFTTQPKDAGVITAQQGFWGYYGARPTPEAEMGLGHADYGRAAVIIAGVAVGAGVLAVLVALRRRATRDQRE